MALETIRAVTDIGLTVVLVTPESGPLTVLAERQGLADKELQIIAPVTVLRKRAAHPLRAFALLFRLIRGVVTARSVIKRLNPALIFVNTITQPSWMIAAFSTRRPLVVHVREREEQLPALVQRILLLPVCLADAILCNSNSTKAWLSANSSVATTGRTSTVYNGKMWPEGIRSRTPFSNQKTQILVVGRISERKGQDIAIRALDILRRSGIDAHLQLVGSVYDGYEPYLQQLHEQILELGLANYCTFLGFLEDPTDLYANADLAWVPSRREPFGSIALEAMACRTPVIASDTEGLREIVEDGVTGLLFRTGSAHSLASKSLSLIGDPELVGRLTENAHSLTKGTFSREKYGVAIQEVVAPLIDSCANR